jgi:hypothetical protein
MQLELNDITLRSTENDTWMYVFVRWAKNMGIEISIFRHVMADSYQQSMCMVDAFVHFLLLTPRPWTLTSKIIEGTPQGLTDGMEPELRAFVGDDEWKSKHHRVYDLRSTAANRCKRKPGPEYVDARGVWVDKRSSNALKEAKAMKLNTGGKSGCYLVQRHTVLQE